jgi:hypothetical protein
MAKSFRSFVEGKSSGVWHASKKEIIQLWKNLKPVPLQMTPVPENQKGTRLHNDGIRITGSARFINGVLSRLKDLLSLEDNPGTRLDLEYREIENKTPTNEVHYLCYIHAEQDLKKKTDAEFKNKDDILSVLNPSDKLKIKPIKPADSSKPPELSM